MVFVFRYLTVIVNRQNPVLFVRIAMEMALALLFYYGEFLVMKKFALILALALVVGSAAFAQGADFTAATPQFLYFDLGAGFGYTLDDNVPESAIGVQAVGFGIAVMENMSVGIDVTGGFAGLRVAYNFTPIAGAAIGLGTITTGSSGAISIGAFGNLFQKRSANGLTTSLKIRLDYIAQTDDLSAGTIVFAPVFSFGL
jgi:opacity protein-like surface antigen